MRLCGCSDAVGCSGTASGFGHDLRVGSAPRGTRWPCGAGPCLGSGFAHRCASLSSCLGGRAVTARGACHAQDIVSIPAYRLQCRPPDPVFRLAEEASLAMVAALPLRAVPVRVMAGLRSEGIRAPVRTFEHVSIASRARVALCSPEHSMAVARIEEALASDEPRMGPAPRLLACGVRDVSHSRRPTHRACSSPVAPRGCGRDQGSGSARNPASCCRGSRSRIAANACAGSLFAPPPPLEARGD